MDKVRELLDSRDIEHITYDYPRPQEETEEERKQRQSRGKERKMRYGEEPAGVVLKYLDLFLTIFHAHSVAAIIMDDDDHHDYAERTIHTMWNPRQATLLEEGQHLARLAIYKAGTDGVDAVLTKTILDAATSRGGTKY